MANPTTKVGGKVRGTTNLRTIAKEQEIKMTEEEIEVRLNEAKTVLLAPYALDFYQDHLKDKDTITESRFRAAFRQFCHEQTTKDPNMPSYDFYVTFKCFVSVERDKHHVSLSMINAFFEKVQQAIKKFKQNTEASVSATGATKKLNIKGGVGAPKKGTKMVAVEEDSDEEESKEIAIKKVEKVRITIEIYEGSVDAGGSSTLFGEKIVKEISGGSIENGFSIGMGDVDCKVNLPVGEKISDKQCTIYHEDGHFYIVCNSQVDKGEQMTLEVIEAQQKEKIREDEYMIFAHKYGYVVEEMKEGEDPQIAIKVYGGDRDGELLTFKSKEKDLIVFGRGAKADVSIEQGNTQFVSRVTSSIGYHKPIGWFLADNKPNEFRPESKTWRGVNGYDNFTHKKKISPRLLIRDRAKYLFGGNPLFFMTVYIYIYIYYIG